MLYVKRMNHDINQLALSELRRTTNRLGYFRDVALEQTYLHETWDHERRQLARFILLVGVLQLLFSFAVVTEFGWDWRFFAGFFLRSFALAVWMYPLWLTRKEHPYPHFNLALYGAGMVQLLVLLWDGAFICIGELDYTSNILLEVLVTGLLFYRSPRHLGFLLLGNFIAFLLIYRGIHSQLEYARTAEFCAVLSVLVWASSIYRIAQERRLFFTHRMLQQQEKSNLIATERQRLAQEMHDGLGGQLIGAFSQLQGGHLTSAEAAKVLQSCIDDMRLVVDAISPTDSDLLSVLGNLRYRMEPRLRQGGISLHWKLGTLPESISLPPEQVLHVLRIAQEAFTNIIKHARAKTVVVSLEVQNGEFCMDISDDGIGKEFNADNGGNHGQHGLINMQNRASSLKGRIILGSNPARGLTTRLTFPFVTA